MRKLFYSILFLSVLTGFAPALVAQTDNQIVERLNYYGKLDNWSVRQITESGIIGGNTRNLYEFCGSPKDTVFGPIPFKAPEGYYWRTNNVLAEVAGVIKCSNTEYPEQRGDGYCMRIETHIEKVKALGIINMEVVCQGAFLLGELPEPIKDTKNPMAKPVYGIPFHSCPRALRFDYKADVGHQTIRGTGFSKLKEMDYLDYPIVTILLQRRWEDNKGRICAKRIGTGVHVFGENAPDWVNGFEVPIHYGDITGESYYIEEMSLLTGDRQMYGINSRGKNVPVLEDSWATDGELPNYMVIYFLSSKNDPFHGGVGNTLWLDNISLEMD